MVGYPGRLGLRGRHVDAAPDGWPQTTAHNRLRRLPLPERIYEHDRLQASRNVLHPRRWLRRGHGQLYRLWRGLLHVAGYRPRQRQLQTGAHGYRETRIIKH